MICLMNRSQNTTTQTATHNSTHAAMTSPTNTTAIHESGKRTDKNMRQQSREKLEVQNEISSTTPASDSVGGLIKS